ncbi:MAG TPA: DJ-1/PfpI family protein, partial [Spirochaetota bacterium]|nr:DJ-1/PfpI family protein [Spirochaetota bacterium]
GLGVENLSKNQAVIDLIKEYFDKKKYVIAICAAPVVLELAGIIKNKTVTSYPSVKEKLKSIKNYSEDKVVIDNKIITSRGFGTAIDLGLRLIELFSGKVEMEKIKKAIVY